MLCGVLAGWHRAGIAARWLVRRTFKTSSRDLFVPVPMSDAPPWYLPPEGGLYRAWEDVHACLRRETIPATGPSGRKRGFTPFTWTLLCGSAGTGKTRMASELVRAWSAEGAGWSCGLLTPRDDPSAIARLRAVQGGAAWLRQLVGWAPSRPTLLVLDDPTAQDAAAVIMALSGQAAQYRFPVRLLVAARTSPLEHVSHHRLAGSPAGTEGGEYAGCVELSGATGLSARDVRVMATAVRLSVASWRDADVERFVRVTGGNPLLVQLGFEWLRQGLKLEAMSATGLIDHHAQALMARLRQQGCTTEQQLGVIAAATLIGPSASNASKARALLVEFDHPSLPPPQAYDGFIPPSPAMAEGETLGGVQPRWVGDAFVRLVLAQSVDPLGTGRRIAAAAWRVAPQATWLAAQRLLAASDGLAASLARRPPAEIGLDDLDVAMLLAQAAMCMTRDEWDSGMAGDGRMVFAHAQSALAALPPQQALMALSRIAALMVVGNETCIMRGDIGLACLCAATGQALAAPGLGQQEHLATGAMNALAVVLEQAARWGVQTSMLPAKALQYPAAMVRVAAKIIPPQAACWEHLATVLDAGLETGTGLPVEVIEPLLTALADALGGPEDAGQDRQRIARVIRLLIAAAACRGQHEAVLAALSLLDRAQGDAGALGSERVWGWRRIVGIHADAGAFDQSHQAALAMDRIVANFAFPRLAMLRCQAQAWCDVARVAAQNGDVAGCVVARDRVLSLKAEPSQALGVFQARLWRFSGWAHAMVADAPACAQAAAQIDLLAHDPADERAFRLEQGTAWGNAAYAFAVDGDAQACLGAVEMTMAAVRRFVGERDFEIVHVKALRRAAYAHALERNLAACGRVLAQVDAIVQSGFPKDMEFALVQAGTHGNLAAACQYNDDVVGCANAAATVDAIAARFADYPAFQLERARAWRHVAEAYAHLPDAAGALRAAQEVETIVPLETADDALADFELARLQAWRSVARARSATHDPVGCETITHEIDRRIQARYAGHARFELERVLAWSDLAWACLHVNDVHTCRVAAQRVDDIIVTQHLEASADLRRERISAWRAVVHVLPPPDSARHAIAAHVLALVKEAGGDHPEFTDIVIEMQAMIAGEGSSSVNALGSFH